MYEISEGNHDATPLEDKHFFFGGGGGIATYISVVKVFSSESISHPILYHISQTMTSSMVIS